MSTTILESAPAELSEVWRDSAEDQRKTEEREFAPGQLPETLSVEQEFALQVDYSHTCFPVEGNISVHVADPDKSPIRLGYSETEGTLEVIGWGMKLPLEKAQELPREIGRRFLELYSKAVTGCLRDEERKWLRSISEQMDYHAFAASRKLPRYREATLIRKEPVLLVQFLEDRNVKLDISLASKLTAVNCGERFAAWFTMNENGAISDLNHVLRLPPLEEDLRDMPIASKPIEFPPGVCSLLPRLEEE